MCFASYYIPISCHTYNEEDINAMTIQGVYLEPLRLHTSEFSVFDQRFGNKIVAMYEINYAEIVSGYLGSEDEWDDTVYYYGTSHCGCLGQRIVNPGNDRIPKRSA
ncbi:hypothetical protein BGZ97_009115 [Linnemannia gamsii]|uniref:Uncharacterized protein n=1 Tax=Linnemannia gamsii TaxID=64522 RepID=A0A9P6UQ21_9FUNG|nr:hypothetical protein BGZ97_009115 [Linnemannia gamsii]